jgi:anti-sigma factor RsiW
MSSAMPHPDPEILLRFIDQDLSPSESSEVSAHLLGCGDCRDRVRALDETLDDYGRFHRDLLKPSLPPPPRAWSAVEFPRARPTRWRLTPWLAGAATVAALLLVVRRFEDAPEVRAAELLRKATVAEHAAQRTKARIRIRRGSRALDRTAVLILLPDDTETPDAAALHAAFDAAGYAWDDPLSADAFSR